MALYQIMQTPGKKIVWPRPARLDSAGKQIAADPPLKNQDEAKAVVARLRNQAKKQKLQADFVIQPIKDARVNNGSAPGGQATSIRLSENNRRELAKFCGRVMMETGLNVSMGEAVLYLIAHYQKTADQFEIPTVLPGQEDIDASDLDD